MLNKATNLLNKQMKEREAMAEKAKAIIADAQEALKALGFESVSIDKVIDVKPIIINKGQIVRVTDDKKEQELTNEIDYLYNEIGRHIGRINQLNAELETKDEIITALKNGAEMKKLTKEDKNTEGGDAMSTQPEKPKRNPLLDKIKKAKEFTMEEAAAEAQAEAEQKAKDKEEAARSKFPKYTLEYESITFDKSMDSKTMFGVRGIITFDEASYPFEATNNHHMPIVYGCFDEDVIRLTKDIIMHEIERFSFMNEREIGAADYRYAKDETFPIVVWRLTDDKGNINYHGYSCTKQYSYILTWDKAKFDYVGRKLVKNAFSSAPNMWKKLSNKQLADKFRAVCASIWPGDFTDDDNDPEPTKDKNATRVTKESHQSTKEFYRITKEQHQTTNDEEIKVTKESHRTTNEIIMDTPMNDFSQPTNDEHPDLTNEAADLDF